MNMITRKISLEDLVEDGIKTLINDKENHVKILVEVGGMSRIDSAIHLCGSVVGMEDI